MRNFAKAAACPADASKKIPPSASFYALFGSANLPNDCMEQRTCLQTDICSNRLFEEGHLQGMASEVGSILTCKSVLWTL